MIARYFTAIKLNIYQIRCLFFLQNIHIIFHGVYDSVNYDCGGNEQPDESQHSHQWAEFRFWATLWPVFLFLSFVLFDVRTFAFTHILFFCKSRSCLFSFDWISHVDESFFE